MTLSIVYQGQTAMRVGIFFLCYENEIFERSNRDHSGQAGPAQSEQLALRVEERAEHRRPLLLDVAEALESAL